MEGMRLRVTVARCREEYRNNWQDCFALLPQSLYTPNCSVFPSPFLPYSYSAPFLSTAVPASHMNSSQKNTNQYDTSSCTYAAHSYQGSYPTDVRDICCIYCFTCYLMLGSASYMCCLQNVMQMPMRQFQQVTTTKKVSTNPHYVCLLLYHLSSSLLLMKNFTKQ